VFSTGREIRTNPDLGFQQTENPGESDVPVSYQLSRAQRMKLETEQVGKGGLPPLAEST